MSVITSRPEPSAPGFDKTPDLSGANAYPGRDAEMDALAQLPAPVLVFLGECVVFANHHAAAFFGVDSADRLVGASAAKLLRVTSGEFEIDTMTDASAARLGHDPITVICRRPDGVSIETQATFGPAQWRGDAACMVCFWPRHDQTSGPGSDVSPNVSPDVSIELPFNVSGYAKWEWRVKAGTFHVSSEFKSHLNYGLENFPTTFLAWTRIIHRDDRAMNERHLIDHLEGRKPIYEIEIRVMTKDGEPRWVKLSGKAIWDGRRIQRVVGVISDVTEQKQRELESADAVARALDTQGQLSDA
ncbi:MAG: PAS domain-containing protein, partial [Rhodospirillales bacterium]|nr:PAS domain-containing protein [Rhodospirillales bacterium]